MDSGYLFLQRVSLLLGLLQLCLKLSDLGNIAGGLKKTRQRSDVFTKVKVRPPGQGPYLSNEGFVLLHQFVQVLLVLLQPLEQVRLLVLQQTQLLVSLQDDTIVESPRNKRVRSFLSPVPLTTPFRRQMFSSSICVFSNSWDRVAWIPSASRRLASLSSS